MVVDPLPHVQSEPRSHQRGELWPPCPQRLEQTRTGLDRNTTHGMLPRVCVCVCVWGEILCSPSCRRSSATGTISYCPGGDSYSVVVIHDHPCLFPVASMWILE